MDRVTLTQPHRNTGVVISDNAVEFPWFTSCEAVLR